jgi:hypothetical protein
MYKKTSLSAGPIYGTPCPFSWLQAWSAARYTRQGARVYVVLFCAQKKRGYISPSYPMFGDGVNAEEKNWHHIIMPGWMDD